MAELNLGELDLTTDEYILDEVDGKSQATHASHCVRPLLYNCETCCRGVPVEVC